MNGSHEQTVKCPHCGEENDVASALCTQCNTPLTAYAGTLTGHVEEATRRRAALAATQDIRPPAVNAMAVFLAAFALFWPLARVVGAFAARRAVGADNTEGLNYIGNAVGMVGPIVSALVLVPAALALLTLAWAVWTQRTWAWTAALAALGLFALLALLAFGVTPLRSLALLLAAGALAFAWVQPRTRAWFGA